MEQKKILIIAEDDGLTSRMARYLNNKGYATVSAADGLDGIDKFKTEKPDLVLLSATLPAALTAPTGFAVCDEIKKAKRSAPVIMLFNIAQTTTNFPRDWRTKADKIMVHPFFPENLLSEVKSLVKEA